MLSSLTLKMTCLADSLSAYRSILISRNETTSAKKKRSRSSFVESTSDLVITCCEGMLCSVLLICSESQALSDDRCGAIASLQLISGSSVNHFDTHLWHYCRKLIVVFTHTLLTGSSSQCCFFDVLHISATFSQHLTGLFCMHSNSSFSSAGWVWRLMLFAGVMRIFIRIFILQ